MLPLSTERINDNGRKIDSLSHSSHAFKKAHSKHQSSYLSQHTNQQQKQNTTSLTYTYYKPTIPVQVKPSALGYSNILLEHLSGDSGMLVEHFGGECEAFFLLDLSHTALKTRKRINEVALSITHMTILATQNNQD